MLSAELTASYDSWLLVLAKIDRHSSPVSAAPLNNLHPRKVVRMKESVEDNVGGVNLVVRPVPRRPPPGPSPGSSGSC